MTVAWKFIQIFRLKIPRATLNKFCNIEFESGFSRALRIEVLQPILELTRKIFFWKRFVQHENIRRTNILRENRDGSTKQILFALSEN
jgi:hypothetical protein